MCVAIKQEHLYPPLPRSQAGNYRQATCCTSEEDMMFEPTLRKMEFFSKERTILWKLGMCVGLFVAVMGVILLVALILKSTASDASDAQIMQMGRGIGEVAMLVLGIGWYIILHRPRKRSK
jgi:hypothetical protein